MAGFIDDIITGKTNQESETKTEESGTQTDIARWKGSEPLPEKKEIEAPEEEEEEVKIQIPDDLIIAKGPEEFKKFEDEQK